MAAALLCFHPSLGIPLITTRTHLDGNTRTHREFPSLFRDSSDHHLLQEDAMLPKPFNVSIPL